MPKTTISVPSKNDLDDELKELKKKERKRAKKSNKQKDQEINASGRLVAPLILGLSILISYLVVLFTGS